MKISKKTIVRDIMGIILFIIFMLLEFTINGAQIMFEILPKTTIFGIIGINLPYFILLISLYLLIWQRLKQVLKKK